MAGSIKSIVIENTNGCKHEEKEKQMQQNFAKIVRPQIEKVKLFLDDKRALEIYKQIGGRKKKPHHGAHDS